MTCPASSLALPSRACPRTSLIDPTPQIRDIMDRYIGNPEFSNLPRKFKTAFTGMPVPDILHEVQDIAFCAVEHPEPGHRL
ncbi:hypothetical protein GCM10025876_23210 [Demequina litorisediminis]|uniref:Nitrite/sulphite reductase 4Fe-4S domain-containing protein n=1 Tax=Demequina litorisediminis TaxID=1849022 RepID=A0ABQ6IE26_9MICO|nr:hypothetical protein GCM10025876_23210 [Demequina litorisediminis]